MTYLDRKALVIDLDDTLVNTACLSQLRNQPKPDWKGCVAQFSSTTIYDEIAETIASLKEKSIAVGVVTSSVSYYAGKLLEYHGIQYDRLVAYHDCNPRKPHPAPVLLCLHQLGVKPKNAIGVGDAAIDAQAYSAAGITAIGAGWSSALDRQARWDRIISTPAQIVGLL